MNDLKEQLKKKDEVLKRFEERKITIDIMVHKIKILGAQMARDKEKMEKVHRQDVDKYEREVHNLINQITNLKFEISKKGVPYTSPHHGISLRQLSHMEKEDPNSENTKTYPLEANDPSNRFRLGKSFR